MKRTSAYAEVIFFVKPGPGLMFRFALESAQMSVQSLKMCLPNSYLDNYVWYDSMYFQDIETLHGDVRAQHLKDMSQIWKMCRACISC